MGGKKPAARLTDIGDQHDGYPPTPIIVGSPDVSCNGRKVARQGDMLVAHSKPNSSTHPRSIAGGAGTVLVNGKPWARQGDPISCGGTIIKGSGDAVIGDKPKNRNPVKPEEWDAFMNKLMDAEAPTADPYERQKLAAATAVQYRGAKGAQDSWQDYYYRQMANGEPQPTNAAVTDPSERVGLARAAKEFSEDQAEMADLGLAPSPTAGTPMTDGGRDQPPRKGNVIPPEDVPDGVFEEIEPNADAVHGYSPKDGTPYSKFDFTDPEGVARNRKIRQEYLEGSKQLEQKVAAMRQSGEPSEAIAREAVAQRNELKVRTRRHMPEDEVASLEQRNEDEYGDPVGPSADQLFKKNRKKARHDGSYESDEQIWEQVIDGATRTDPVIATLLGLKAD